MENLAEDNLEHWSVMSSDDEVPKNSRESNTYKPSLSLPAMST